ncbi:hypothetical protein KCP77_07015 [Salmonella enterica subsp. enterica]|nr:hypothetical protein KCP77_07015 [Salmonella enterica subsp. enterica]
MFELNAKQREVLARRFGLYWDMKLRHFGRCRREIGLTRELCVRQIQVEGTPSARILQVRGG